MKLRILAPVLSLIIAIIAWEAGVALTGVSKFILPPPSAIGAELIGSIPEFATSAAFTLKITLLALAAALVTGLVLAFLFSLSGFIEAALSPIAVILQVTPIVAVAPLILIWVGIDHVERALVIIAWLAAFFPILATLTSGLKAVDPALADLFRLYKATPWQRFSRLVVPTALPYLFAGLRVGSGLALIGAVVAEFVAGSGEAAGLAWRILEAGNRLQVERLFVGLVWLIGMGVALYYSVGAAERFLMKAQRVDKGALH
ncbi:ABC transporter permease [Gimibacter soli]|uniref:ABC transporter permease n=1 Tax=Gimibacter soli TaxID=3024400 RepID=A0AAE9XUA3_9PROT|nr:ABC transporter permease [Gimibacter soli]WCL52824.1 ABC transporter permease [Gimibacter soli]